MLIGYHISHRRSVVDHLEHCLMSLSREIGGQAKLVTPQPTHPSINPRPCDLGFVRGAVGNRTPDPFHAMEVLYQLSYSPERVQDDTRAPLTLKT